MSFDQESWQRAIFEALRPIDPKALFNVSLVEMDFRNLGDAAPGEFPSADLVSSVNQWLAGLDPDAGVFTTEWSGGGVRLLISAKGRGPAWRGSRDMPSFNMLEPVIGTLHLVSGEERRLIDLTLEEVEQLADGKQRLVGQGASYEDTFQAMRGEMRHFGLTAVVELHPTVITTYASMLGLIDGLNVMGNYDATWREVHRKPPNH
jgi:hypothetical protein